MPTPFERACEVIPGGVNSPVRAFRGVGGTPIFFESGSGAEILDVEGGRYIDYVGSWGPLIVGHAHPRVVAAVQDQAAKGTSFGAPCELETALASRVCARVDGCERVRFVSSGTEATMSAIRLARGATGRDELVKIEGCYHGHVDSLLVQAGSGLLTLGIPGSPGVPEPLAKLTHVVPFNDVAAVEALFATRGDRIAGIIVEPIAGNMGVIPPQPGYLAALREITKRHSALLILDEVMTGFRVSPGGAQQLYDVKPDVSCFGKVIGGGLPAAAYAGSAELMEQMAPNGPIYQAGTLSGNPLAMRAGIETLDLLDDAAYATLERRAAQLEHGLAAAASAASIPLTINRVGSMLTAFFYDQPVRDFGGATAADSERYAKFFHGMLKRGIYLAPSAFEAAFVSTAHGEQQIERTIEAAAEVMATL